MLIDRFHGFVTIIPQLQRPKEVISVVDIGPQVAKVLGEAGNDIETSNKIESVSSPIQSYSYYGSWIANVSL